MNQQKTGKYIADKRKLHNMTQAQLAEKLGVSDRAVSKWERGLSMPDVSKYEKLCEVLEVSLNELFAGEDLDERKFREQSDQNLIGATKKEQVLRKRYNVLKVIMILIALAASIWVADYYMPKAVGVEHIDPLAYELPGEYSYTHSQNDIITFKTGFGIDEVIIGKIYKNKDARTKIIVSQWDDQWNCFESAIEYEKTLHPGTLEEYHGAKPDFMEQIAVFHGKNDMFDLWENSLFYQYKYYYKVYLMTDEKHNMYQYVVTVYGDDFNKVCRVGESLIATMVYNEDLEVEFVRKEYD